MGRTATARLRRRRPLRGRASGKTLTSTLRLLIKAHENGTGRMTQREIDRLWRALGGARSA